MKSTTPAEAVCIELSDGTMLYGTVTDESTEIDGHVQVVTKTIRVHPGESMTTTDHVRRYVTTPEEV
ncbi:hypothetical protein [Corynebacterium freneyi]|uniref:Uncharacterized protein n=1 Tax=Corynebacterium freneyi TaxID=134034 RepID=A0ABS4U9W4_9CORY|nr:hypothetical protein [Corynebacterium freneyi]MBP2333310.1 hypothetical protein [Corynebacterium freneyi]QXA52638.1 hypothetical protein I6L56_11430 [Corynebacterium freneyi]WJZ04586.1 hypothetical protein CFREN_03000 [Corynebacterium freneyi]